MCASYLLCTDRTCVGLVLIGCMCVYNSPCVIPAGSLKTLPNYSTSEAKRVWIDSWGKVLKWCPNLSPRAVCQARGWYFIHPNLDFHKLFCLWRKRELGSNSNQWFLGDGFPPFLCPLDTCLFSKKRWKIYARKHNGEAVLKQNPVWIGTGLVTSCAFGAVLILCIKHLTDCRWMSMRDFKFSSVTSVWCLLLTSEWAGKFRPKWCCNKKLEILQ